MHQAISNVMKAAVAELLLLAISFIYYCNLLSLVAPVENTLQLHDIMPSLVSNDGAC